MWTNHSQNANLHDADAVYCPKCNKHLPIEMNYSAVTFSQFLKIIGNLSSLMTIWKCAALSKIARCLFKAMDKLQLLKSLRPLK